jgi:hypothetical protein
MRFTLTALAWLLMFGGLSLYIHQRDRQKPSPLQAPIQQGLAAREFTLELTATFSPEADPFALQGDEAAAAPLVVRTAAQELYRTESLEPGVALRVTPVHGLVEGRNELYVQAQPPVSEAGLDHAVRIRLLQDSRVLVDQTLWGQGGSSVAGTIPFTLETHGEEPHEH